MKNVLFFKIEKSDNSAYKYLSILLLYYYTFNFTQTVIDELVAKKIDFYKTFIEELIAKEKESLAKEKNSNDNKNDVNFFVLKNLDELTFLYMYYDANAEISKIVRRITKKVLIKTLRIYSNNSSMSIFKDTLKQILDVNSSVTIGIEMNYVDRIYRDTYYNFFSNLHENFSRSCKRLIFFKDVESCNIINLYINSTAKEKKNYEMILNENFIGSMVIRPLKTGAIGRTLFNPKNFLESDAEYYVRTSQWKISFLGLELSVKAFPFLMQDGITTSCAETVLLALMDYYSQQYNDYKFALPSAINDINMRENGTRAIPTNGLSYETMSKILCEFGFYTTFDCNFNNRDLRRYLYYYVESGIPIIINMQREDKVNSADSVTGHAALWIGHGEKEINNLLSNVEYENGIYYANTASAYEKIYVMDDNLRPYSCYTYNDLNSNYFMKRGDEKQLNIDCYIVPLHKHMYMDAKRAEDIVRELLSCEVDGVKPYNPSTYCPVNRNTPWGETKNPIIYRLFLASSRHLKHHRMQNNDNAYLIDLYAETPMPQFVWVCEFYTKDSYCCDQPYAIGEIVIDATRCAKSSLFSSVLMINYSGSVHYVRNITNKETFNQQNVHNYSGQNEIALQKNNNNLFDLAPYNSNLHDKNFF